MIQFRRRRGESRLKFKKLKSMLHRRKSIKYPKLPKTHAEACALLQDPKISTEFLQTADQNGKFYVGSEVKKEHSYHVFASYSVVELITKHMVGQPRRYLIDGTFKVVPRGFAQLLIIAIEYRNKVNELYLAYTLSLSLTHEHFFCLSMHK